MRLVDNSAIFVRAYGIKFYGETKEEAQKSADLFTKVQKRFSRGL